MRSSLFAFFCLLCLAGAMASPAVLEDEDSMMVFDSDYNPEQQQMQQQPEEEMFIGDIEEEEEEGNDDDEEEEDDSSAVADDSEDDDSSDEQEDDADDEDVEVAKKKLTPEQKAARKAQLRLLYNNLRRRYRSLRSEISSRLRAVMWRKFSWLRLLHARRRWYLINKRYRKLVKKYKKLPQKKFLVNAWKRYTQTEEYQLQTSGALYNATKANTTQYLQNLDEWIADQKQKISDLRSSVKTFLAKNADIITKVQAEKLRLAARRHIRDAKKKLSTVEKYWKNRIQNGDLPPLEDENQPTIVAPKKESAATREKLLLKGVPTRIPTPHPMVAPKNAKSAKPVVAVKKTAGIAAPKKAVNAKPATGVNFPAGPTPQEKKKTVKKVKKESKWIRALLVKGKKNNGKDRFASKSDPFIGAALKALRASYGIRRVNKNSLVKKNSSSSSSSSVVVPEKKNKKARRGEDWFEPIREKRGLRSKKSASRRAKAEQRRVKRSLRRGTGKKSVKRNDRWTRNGGWGDWDASKERKWRNAIRNAFKDAWKQ